MRVFQNNGLSRGFAFQSRRTPSEKSFEAEIARYLQTRVSAPHLLEPVLAGDPTAFYTNGDDKNLQLLWARKNGLRSDDLSSILLAQVEHHRSEVFYNLDPMKYGSDFVVKLPGCVKRAICWRAAPSRNADLSGYDLVVGNFPSILADWERKGCRVAYFVPGHDPELDRYADQRHEEVDLVFVGGFSRHHGNRSAALLAAALTPEIQVRFHLEDGRLTQLANKMPFLFGLRRHSHPPEIRAVRSGPVYGRDLYKTLASARIVLNGAVDMAGPDRGNMRCFEATGSGALLLSDAGNYPAGFVDGETMMTYSSPEQIPTIINSALRDPDRSRMIARAGRKMVQDLYSKRKQWQFFQELV
jgi:hypothetical protein